MAEEKHPQVRPGIRMPMSGQIESLEQRILLSSTVWTDAVAGSPQANPLGASEGPPDYGPRKLRVIELLARSLAPGASSAAQFELRFALKELAGLLDDDVAGRSSPVAIRGFEYSPSGTLEYYVAIPPDRLTLRFDGSLPSEIIGGVLAIAREEIHKMERSILGKGGGG